MLLHLRIGLPSKLAPVTSPCSHLLSEKLLANHEPFSWLPAPANGALFSVASKQATLTSNSVAYGFANCSTVRLYAPSTSLANGNWTYPTVQKLASIKE